MKMNKAESLLLMGSMRLAICESIDLLNVPSKNEMKNFVINEATDHDVMYFALTESFPTGKATTKDVENLYEAFGTVVASNFTMISEAIGRKNAMTLITEVSAFDSIKKGTYLREEGAAINKSLKAFRKSQEGEGDKAKALRHGGEHTPGAGFLRKTSDHIKNAYDDIHDRTVIGAHRLKHAAGETVSDILKKAHKAADQAGASGVGQQISKAFKKVSGKDLHGTHAGVIVGVGGVVAAGLLIYGAIKTYKRFFSKAAQACAGKSGAEKTACMEKARGNALMAQKRDLSSASSACAKTKNPAKCKSIIAARMKKIGKKK